MPPDLFSTLSKTRDASRHQAVVDGWAWTPPDAAISPAAADFDAAFEAAFDANRRMTLATGADVAASCPWRVLFQSPLLAVEAVPGRGMGVVARAPVARGALLLHELGVVGTRERLACWLLATGEALAPPVARALETWSPFRNVALHDWNLALSRVAENKFTAAVGDPADDGGAYSDGSESSAAAGDDANDAIFVLCRLLSRVNHACEPTTARHMGGAGGAEAACAHLFALRDIAAGEEITMRYSAEEGHGAMTEFFACACKAPLRVRARASTREADAARLAFETMLRSGA
jgi:hypothetical protein